MGRAISVILALFVDYDLLIYYVDIPPTLSPTLAEAVNFSKHFLLFTVHSIWRAGNTIYF